ncbi:MAG: hypothetical protein LIO97_05185 [Tannerellaceae bacterium]|nr:hypothetical protein [Tannerellaceae bacterium]
MNKLLITLFIFLLPAVLPAEETPYDHIFFDNARMTGAWFYSEATYTSPSYLQTSQNKLPVTDAHAFTPSTSILLNYISATGGNWSATLLYPDWRGKDFIKEANSLDFRLLLTSNTLPAELPLIAIATQNQQSVSQYIPLQEFVKNTPTNEWIYITIPLGRFTHIAYTHTKEIKQLLFKQAGNDGKEHILYIDQVELAPSQEQQPGRVTTPAIQAQAYERHVDITWNTNGLNRFKYIKVYRGTSQGDFLPVGIQNPLMGRYTDFTGETGKTYQYKVTLLNQDYNETAPSGAVSATTFAMTDEQLLDMVQEAHFRYYWEGAEPVSGLARENIPGRQDMIATGASGFGLMAIVTAIDRGFITREEGVERFLTITSFLENTSFLEKADSFHGAVSHFMDGPTGKTVPFFGPKDNGADLVETSFLYQGLLVAHQYFNKDTEEEQQIRHWINTL